MLLSRESQVGRAGSAPCGDYKLDEVALPPPPPRARAAAAEVRREVAGLGPRRWNNCTSSGHGGRHADASELLSTTTDAKGRRVDTMVGHASTISFSKPAVSLAWDCRTSVDRGLIGERLTKSLHADRAHFNGTGAQRLSSGYCSPEARQTLRMAALRERKEAIRAETADLSTVYGEAEAALIMRSRQEEGAAKAKAAAAGGGGAPAPPRRRPRATRDDIAAVLALPGSDDEME